MLIMNEQYGYFNIRDFRQRRPSCLPKERYEEKMCAVAQSILHKKKKICEVPKEQFEDRQYECCKEITRGLENIRNMRINLNLQGLPKQEDKIFGINKEYLLLGLVGGLVLYFILR